MGDSTKQQQTKKGPNEEAPSDEQVRLAAMLEVLYEHRDELTRMATELPTLLRETGQQMHDAGTRAQTASGYLAGDVRELTGHAADMLESSKHQLLAVLHALEKAGGMLKNLPFIGDMGKMMGDQLGAIGDVAHNLDQVGQKVRGLGDRLGDVGDDLHLMGASLLGGGAGLGSYGGAPAPKKTPAKKAPAKKAPAKAVGSSGVRQVSTAREA